jgi:thiamine-phosphate pyrophosphorylase
MRAVRRTRPRAARHGAARASLLRLIDANANRGLEGLRVCEEIARFHDESATTFKRVRALRHDLAEAVRRLPAGAAELLRARDSGGDIGRTAPAGAVDSLERLALINFQRAKEAIRTLEECARLLAPRHAAAFSRLRFRTYAIEQAFVLRLASLRHP